MGVWEVYGCSGVGDGEFAALLGQGSQSSVKSENVSGSVGHGWHGMGDGWLDASLYKGQALSRGGSLGDGLGEDVVPLGFDGVHGCSHLGGPVESEADVDP